MTATSPGPGSPVQGELAGMPKRLYGASPSRLLTWLDCPRRYRMAYLDRPRPKARPPRAHTSLGVAVHSALRDFWDVPIGRRLPARGDELVRRSWVSAGFRDAEQSERWRAASATHVTSYLQGVDPARQPVGVERTVAFKTPALAVVGRIDRLDERPTADGPGSELVVVDYKTSRSAPSAE
ncbi:MAG TPA: PD-(D/E)XK nuclease family protein, partial [Candidatus Lustribacter sp.]|nr:PD-(D/E)XK nuclease family protein [Candidatus Lustribacter sp.]